MPYIDEPSRKAFDPHIEGLFPEISSPGELNYVISRICKDYLGYSPNYSDYNEVIGALECAKLELYRRQVVPYEEKKIEKNGDI